MRYLRVECARRWPLAARDGPQDSDQQVGSDKGHDQGVDIEAIDTAVAQQREDEATQERPMMPTMMP